MKMYAITEAREHFSSIVKAAESGEQIVLTRHGKPVVTIQPTERQRPKPGFMARAGFSAKMSSDFNEIPPGFEEYV